MLLAINTTTVGEVLGMKGCSIVSMVFYPLPEEVTMEDSDALNKYMEVHPLGAMLLVVFSHDMGSLVGTLAATLVAQISKWRNSYSS